MTNLDRAFLRWPNVKVIVNMLRRRNAPPNYAAVARLERLMRGDPHSKGIYRRYFQTVLMCYLTGDKMPSPPYCNSTVVFNNTPKKREFNIPVEEFLED